MPRMLRSAISAFTRVADALWRCAADPGSIVHSASAGVPALRCIVRDDASHRRENAAPRPGHETHCFTLSQDDGHRLRVYRLNAHDIGGRLPAYLFITWKSAMVAAWFVVIQYKLRISPIL